MKPKIAAPDLIASVREVGVVFRDAWIVSKAVEEGKESVGERGN